MDPPLMNDNSDSKKAEDIADRTKNAPGPGFLKSVGRVLGIGIQSDGSVRSTLEELIDKHDDPEQPINPEERLMLANILGFAELDIDDVMIPRADIEAIDTAMPFDDVINKFRETYHSRLPVYRDNLDGVFGMLHIKDLIKYWGAHDDVSWIELCRDMLFVPPSMSVPDLLLKMRASHIHMAMVVDEYGGIDGLVTIEDLVEEIVGDIEDEHDKPEGPLIILAGTDIYEADARAEIEEAEALLEVSLIDDDDDEDIDTIGGLVFRLAGHIPSRGEIIKHSTGLEFEILDADPRKVKKVRIRKQAQMASKAE